MSQPGLQGKSHDIPKRLIWVAWQKVKSNGGAAGADGAGDPVSAVMPGVATKKPCTPWPVTWPAPFRVSPRIVWLT